MSSLPLVEIDFGGEGRTDAEAARKMILAAGALPGRDFTLRSQPRGREALDRALAGYNAGARFTPILVLRDLDNLPCAAEAVAARLPQRHGHCFLRIAVRSLDAWLMADRDAIANFAKVRAALVPDFPETLPRPKDVLMSILRQSKNRPMRRALGIDDGTVGWQMIGAWSAEFIRDHWDPERAARIGRAPSLTKAMHRLRMAATAK